MQKSFSQNDIFQKNEKTKQTASRIVGELKQLDSLKHFANLQQQLIQKSDSIIFYKDKVIDQQKQIVENYMQILSSTEIQKNALEADLKEANKNIAVLQSKKPKRLLWSLGGAVITILTFIAIK